jgi:uncharacterized repeat protein (TIGR03803 family)
MAQRIRASWFGAAILVLAAGLWPQGAGAYTEHVIYSFCSQARCSDGQAPFGALTIDAARNLYGTTVDGGDAGDGAAFELVYDGSRWTYRRLYSFCALANCSDGNGPVGNLVRDTQGNLYGVTRSGGPNFDGTIFELSPKQGGWSLRTLHTFCAADFTCPDGSHPIHGLTYQGAAAGLPYDGVSPLYGTTSDGGAQNFGTIYQITSRRRAWTHKVLHDFCQSPECADGAGPYDVLTIGMDGRIFGTTSGYNNRLGGTVFELTSSDAGRWHLATLYGFCALAGCADGESANSLLQDANGDLIGTTYTGGPSGQGVLFRFGLGAGNPGFSVLHGFCTADPQCSDGALPQNGPSLSPSGDVLGVTQHGGHTGCWFDDSCGTIYRYDGTSFQVIYTFCAQSRCTDGAFPYAELVGDGTGAMFGMAELGGTHNGGAVYELSP